MKKYILFIAMMVYYTNFLHSQGNTVTELYRIKKIIKPFNNPIFRTIDMFVEFSLKAPQHNFYLFLMNDSTFSLISKHIYSPETIFRREDGIYGCKNDTVTCYSNNNSLLIIKYPCVLIKQKKKLITYDKEKEKYIIFKRKRILRKYLYLIDNVH